MDILRTLEHLLGDVLDEKRDANGEPLPPLLPTVLLGIRARLEELTSLQLEPTGNGLESWLEKVRSLTGTPETRETMAVRLLQLKLPRVAETLALAGAITMPQGAPNGRPHSFRINWAHRN
ncbi:hypothetical protein SAMN06298212_1322 [Ruaniaceae bacterium KH17]|nr:hypothetical protein SAMN06298212_1322 [Ruaniaceae bacterium KH17]